MLRLDGVGSRQLEISVPIPGVAEISPKDSIEDDDNISELLSTKPDEEFRLVELELPGNSWPLVIASKILSCWCKNKLDCELCPGFTIK